MIDLNLLLARQQQQQGGGMAPMAQPGGLLGDAQPRATGLARFGLLSPSGRSGLSTSSVPQQTFQAPTLPSLPWGFANAGGAGGAGAAAGNQMPDQSTLGSSAAGPDADGSPGATGVGGAAAATGPSAGTPTGETAPGHGIPGVTNQGLAQLAIANPVAALVGFLANQAMTAATSSPVMSMINTMPNPVAPLAPALVQDVQAIDANAVGPGPDANTDPSSVSAVNGMDAASDAAGGGGGGGGKVICTALHARGWMPDAIFAADQAFGARLVREDPAAYAGYYRWARHVARWMNRPDGIGVAVSAIAYPLAIRWAWTMARAQGVSAPRSATGVLLLRWGLVACRALGRNLVEDIHGRPA